MQRVVIKLTTGKKVKEIEVFTNIPTKDVQNYASEWLQTAGNLTARSLSKYIQSRSDARCMCFRDYKREYR